MNYSCDESSTQYPNRHILYNLYKSNKEHETNCIFALMGDALTNAISAKLGMD